MHAALLQAIDDDDTDGIRRILEEVPSLICKTDEYEHTPLMHAASYFRVKCVRALIEAGADVNAKTTEGYTALHCVIHPYMGATSPRETRKIVRLLVEAGADLEVAQHWGWTPLMYAVMEGTADDVDAFLEAGANANKIFPQHALPEFTRGRSVLAISSLDPEMMELLLEAGADVNLRDDYGQTALEYVRNLDTTTYERQKWVCWNLLRKAQK